ncbi:MAG: AAA family ATPase [Myxococcales bacterium]|nr:AAA family ATPase [Myxococcales bacterium]
MKIRHLTVRNFRGLTEQSVDFTDADGKVRPLTVIVGPNRSGKTTLLDAIHIAQAVSSSPTTPTFRPGFDAGDPRLRPNPNRSITVQIDFELEAADEPAAIDEIALVVAGPVFAVQPRQTLTLSWPPLPPPLTVRGTFLPGADDGSLDARAAFAARARAHEGIARRLIERSILDRIGGVLYLDQNRHFPTSIPLAQTASDLQLAQAAAAGDILPWIELQARLDVRWDPATKGPSGWTRLRDLFARLARPSVIDDMEPFPEGYDLRFRDTRTDRTYYLAGTSSGERMMLRLAASLTAFGHRRSVVLIDEIELHLHPRWQRNLLHFCQQGADGDTQFIVTTHSDTFLHYVDPGAIVSLGDLDT